MAMGNKEARPLSVGPVMPKPKPKPVPGRYVQIYQRGEHYFWRVRDQQNQIVSSTKTGYVLRTLCIHMAERLFPDLPIYEQGSATKSKEKVRR